MRRWPSGPELLLLGLAAAAGCEEVGSVGTGFTPDTSQLAWLELSFAPPTDLDLLFVIDDSAGMRPAQEALAHSLTTLAGALEKQMFAGTPLHVHLGAITSDLGAGMTAAGECALFGDAGLLVPVGRAAADDCVPLAGRFLDLDPTGGGNLPQGRTLEQTLGCMLAIGNSGCGFAQPLEAAYRALSDSTNNAGFLRDGALLMVVFVTGQDDCSAPVGSDLFDPAHTELGPFDSFRCLTGGVTCGSPPSPPAPGGPRDDCAPAPGGLLYDLARYRDFFFAPAGVKRDPNLVQLLVSAGPAIPVWVKSDLQGNPQLQPTCSTGSLIGLPAVRLSALAASSPRSLAASICSAGADDYLFDTLAAGLDVTNATTHCLPAPIADSDHPECTVSDGNLPVDSCAATSGVAPCWELVTRPECVPIYDPHTRGNEQLALSVRRLALTAGPATTLDARCRVLDAPN